MDNAEGTTITVDAGCLWVTMERDPRDIVLLPGMSFEIDRTGRTVIAAEEDSRFRLLSEVTPASRAVAWLARHAATAVGALGRSARRGASPRTTDRSRADRALARPRPVSA